MRAFLELILMVTGCRAGDAFGIWNMNPARSTDPYPICFTVRFEPHAKGEVFTLDRISAGTAGCDLQYHPVLRP